MKNTRTRRGKILRVSGILAVVVLTTLPPCRAATLIVGVDSSGGTGARKEAYVFAPAQAGGWEITTTLGLTTANSAKGAILDSSGNFYASNGGNIYKFDADLFSAGTGEFVPAPTAITQTSTTTSSLALDPSGTFYMGANGSIKKYTTNASGKLAASNILTSSGSQDSGGVTFGDVTALAFDATGSTLYFVNYAGQNILKSTWDSDGQTWSAATVFSSSSVRGYGMAVDASGNLWIVAQSDGKIYRYDTDGARTTFASLGAVNARGLTFDPVTGDLYISGGNPASGETPGSGFIYRYLMTASGLNTTHDIIASGLDATIWAVAVRSTIPEPTSCALLAAVALFLFAAMHPRSRRS
jgi:sugar lactone lactonase YvrE